MRNAFIYCRVAAQDEPYSSDALNRQEEACSEYANNHKIYIKNIFKEVGSGSASKRGFIGSLTDYLRDNEIEIVLVSGYNRISRNLVELFSLTSKLNQAGINIIPVNDDRSMALSLMVESFIRQSSEFERKVAKNRSRRS